MKISESITFLDNWFIWKISYYINGKKRKKEVNSSLKKGVGEILVKTMDKTGKMNEEMNHPWHFWHLNDDIGM